MLYATNVGGGRRAKGYSCALPLFPRAINRPMSRAAHIAAVYERQVLGLNAYRVLRRFQGGYVLNRSRTERAIREGMRRLPVPLGATYLFDKEKLAVRMYVQGSDGQVEVTRESMPEIREMFEGMDSRGRRRLG